ncbi:MAG: P-loop NTPase [Magnetococcales bacterium]|nr:P-loop NTPase [Magnetococcales bacterium]
MGIVVFNQAIEIALCAVTQHLSSLPRNPIILRDLRGRIRIALDASEENEKLKKSLTKLADQLHPALGAFTYGKEHLFLFREGVPDPKHFFKSADLIPLKVEGKKTIYLLERLVTGQDWVSPADCVNDRQPQRFTFFGLKGGVGRSTVAAVWAWHLARNKYKVLVVDLDLESPGVGSMLLPNDKLPEFGIVDWFVESMVGQEALVVPAMVGKSTLPGTNEGWIRVVPAYGRGETDYMAKLSRCYQDLPTSSGRPVSWADRLERMLDALEQQERPDVVLLDSRAGLHDISAVTVTRLGATAFLFAIHTPQTWMGYRHLFRHWQQRHTRPDQFRDRLQIVAGMIPDLDADHYLEGLREEFYRLFVDTLYEEGTDETAALFNFDLNDRSAPHTPWNVRWQIALQGFDPVNRPNRVPEQILQAAFGEFFERADLLLPQLPAS